MFRMLTLVVLITLTGCQTPKGNSDMNTNASDDPNLWLEEVESPRALDKVREWNARSTSELEADPRYKEIEAQTRAIVLAKDRIPYGSFFGHFVYNFWQDEKNVRGLWRRTSLSEYAKTQPKWEVLIDLDELAKKENENWVWKHASCLAPEYDRCLLTLSRGGKDAAVLREFSLKQKDFVKDGFTAPEAKFFAGWIDHDTLFFGTDFGPGSVTKSGYNREVRIWKRGTPYNESKKIFESTVEDISASGWTSHSPYGQRMFLERSIDFDHRELYLLNDKWESTRMPTPLDFMASVTFKNRFAGVLRSDLSTPNGIFKAGSAVAYDLDHLQAPPKLIYEPRDREAVKDIDATRDFFVLSINANVKGHLLKATPNAANDAWTIEPIALPDNGEVGLLSAEAFSNTMLATYASFLVPDSVYSLVGSANGKPQISNTISIKISKLISLPARFKSDDLKVEQLEATSRDGTKVPYFVVHKKNIKYDGQNPTLLYGYGGFMISMNPSYAGSMGKVFLEKGGVYALANIRGGGEFGPKWHEAGLKTHRQRVFDDFIAVGEDLVQRKITSPKWLGIRGGSNGGLLTGTVFTQRPDLFGAVLCEVPLLDMLRFHKLLAGFSWIAEYGNPEIPEEAAALRAYSPYQNLKAGVKYPRIFLLTSTKDDRVHPGHARKMAARLEQLNSPFLYYENIEGGHGAAANLEQRIKFSALEWTYVWRQLGTGK